MKEQPLYTASSAAETTTAAVEHITNIMAKGGTETEVFVQNIAKQLVDIERAGGVVTSEPNIPLADIPIGNNTVIDTEPIKYRLGKKLNGEIVLQGLYKVYEPYGGGWCVKEKIWKDLPTVDLPE